MSWGNDPSPVEGLTWRELGQLVARELRPLMHFTHWGVHTVAWRRVPGSVVEFSTAICNPSDKNEPLVGEYEAGRRLLAHEVCRLRLSHKRNPHRLFRTLLNSM